MPTETGTHTRRRLCEPVRIGVILDCHSNKGESDAADRLSKRWKFPLDPKYPAAPSMIERVFVLQNAAYGRHFAC